MSGDALHRPAAAVRKAVERRRVTAALDGLQSRSVAAVRARAGAGKSFVLERWAHERVGTAYVELEARHDAPDAFLSALAAALQVDLGEALTRQAFPRVDIEEVLDARSPHIDLLVLDATERLHDPWVLHALDTLVMYASPSLRLVLSGRSIPPVTSLAVLRMRDALVSVDDAAFRLDDREACELFAIAAERAPDAALVRRLMDFSEGWLAGFQIAAREWRVESERSEEERLADAMSPIRDFLLGDVLARLPTRWVSLLVDASVLDVIDPMMCDALRGTDDSARALREIEHASAFVQRVPGQQDRYRLHRLMRVTVADWLGAGDAGRARDLHARAAEMNRQAGDEPAAMRHLIGAGKVDEAWEMFHDHWIERYFAGSFATVVAWTDALGATDPWDAGRAGELAVALLLLGQLERAEDLLAEVSRRDGEMVHNRSEAIEVARYLHSFARGSMDVALVHAERAREAHDGAGPPLWERLRASIGLCFLLAFVDRISDAWEAFESASRYEDPASRVDAVTYPTALAHLALTEGRLGEAEAFAERALRAGQRLDPRARATLCEANHTKGFVHLERNEVDEAEYYLLRAIETGDTVAFAHIRVLPRLGMARVHHVRGHRDLAYRLLDECRHLPDVRLDRHFTERIAEVEAHMRLREGDARGALEGLPSMHSHRLRLVEVRALAALGEHQSALDLLARSKPPGPRRGIHVSLVLARCLPDHNSRLRALREALQLAEQQGYLRMLLDERSWLVDRLLAVVHTWPTDYVERVIEAAMQESSPAVAARVPIAVLTPLSPREVEVWRYLATPLPLGEIAGRLFVSRNTMKTHVRNIYRKLGVATREQAIAVEVAEYGSVPRGGDLTAMEG